MSNIASRLEGVSVVPVTPFDASGMLDERSLRQLILRLVRGGLEVIMPGGNTGEYFGLSREEASRVVVAVVEEAGAHSTILAGVGGDLGGAVESARQALRDGADGILIHQPRDPYITESGLIRYYETLADEGGGVVALYIRDSTFPDTVLEHVVGLDAVIAVKWAVPDVLRLARLVERHSDQAVWTCGLAEWWAPFFWLAGARGFTSGLANVAPHLSLAMLEALRAHDYVSAMTIWRRIVPFEELRARNNNGNNVSVVKEALALLGVISDRAVRPPLASLSPADGKELMSICAEWQLSEPRAVQPTRAG